MRYMCLMKSSESNGETPPAVYEAMAEYDRWGRANGVLVDSQGLLPSSTRWTSSGTCSAWDSSSLRGALSVGSPSR